jgi:hypothetical protein
MKTCAQLTLLDCEAWTSLPLDGPARDTASLESVSEAPIPAAVSSPRSCASLMEWLLDPDGYCWRMSPVWLVPGTDETFPQLSTSFDGGVMWDASGAWTLNTLEWPSDGAACSLSSVLEPQVSERFNLSSKAAAGILRRAERRGKALPDALGLALVALASQSEET